LSVLAGCSGTHSGATPTGAPAAGGAPPSTPVASVDTHFTGENSDRFCVLARTYNDSFAGIGASPTAAQLRTVAQEGQRSINEALGAAPSEIKGDVEVVARTFGGFLGDLEKVGFDVAKLPTTALTRFAAADFQAATTRFAAYVRTVCGAE
jgi:hypothetical protein